MTNRGTRVLTAREQEVIELLAAGCTNEEIARRLGISLAGVKYHVSGIFRRLRVTSRHEAASLHLGIEGGVLTPREEDVIELLSTGLTNEEISRQLGITVDGVKYHVSGILKRLDVASRREAASLHLRTERSGRLAALVPVMLFRKLPFAWLSKAVAGGVLTVTVAGIALLTWGVMTTSTATVTTTACNEERTAGAPPNCAPGAAQAAGPADAVTAISSGHSHSCALRDGGVWCWGGYFGDDPVAVPELERGVSAISSGGMQSCALKDGGVWCWTGYSGDGPVAVPGLESGVSAISVSDWLKSCALKDGAVWCWEPALDEAPSALVLRINVDGAAVGVRYSAPAVTTGLSSGVTAISDRNGNTCAVKDGGAWCSGHNWYGQLGNNGTDSLVPAAVSGLGSGVTAISVGDEHVCALKEGGVWCWGSNYRGRLGNGSTTEVCAIFSVPCSRAPVPVPGLTGGVSAISSGSSHTCALKDGGVWCWGANGNGELGNNSATDSPVPIAVPGLGSGVSAIGAGSEHTCVLKEGIAWCWGANRGGQPGNSTRTWHSLVPVPVRFTSSVVGDIVAAPNAKPAPSQTSPDAADHRGAYLLSAAAAAALALVAAAAWAMRRRRVS